MAEKQGIMAWADGYGLWWALVPNSVRHNRARAARTAINLELSVREGLGFAGVAVERVGANTEGYVAYREVAA